MLFCLNLKMIFVQIIKCNCAKYKIHLSECRKLGKPQFEKGRVYLGIAQMVWGTYFEKNCPCSKGHLLGLGGLNPCQDGLGHLCSEN